MVCQFRKFSTLSIIFASNFILVTYGLKRGDVCSDRKSVCTWLPDCPSAMLGIDRGVYPSLCNFDKGVAVVCCAGASSSASKNDDSVIFPTSVSESLASRSCARYRAEMCSKRSITSAGHSNNKPRPVIVGGVEAQPKQFPHMAPNSDNVVSALRLVAKGLQHQEVFKNDSYKLLTNEYA